MNRKQAEHDRTVLPRIHALLAQGRSRREIAEQLQQDGVPTARRGGKWTHIAVGRILGRADRTQPQEASPAPPPAKQPPGAAEQPPSPTEQPPPPAPAEPPPAQAEQLQQIVAQTDAALQQLSSVPNQLGTIKSQIDQRSAALNWGMMKMGLYPAAVGAALFIGGIGAALGVEQGMKYDIGSYRKERDTLKLEIEQQQATLRELEQETWGVGYHEGENGRFLILPEGSKRNWTVDDKPAVKLPDK